MRTSDRALFSHSVKEQGVVGVCEVVREGSPDPTAKDGSRVVVDLAPVKPLARPATLAEIKADQALADIPLVRQARLSVMPLAKAAFDRIVALGKSHRHRCYALYLYRA